MGSHYRPWHTAVLALVAPSAVAQESTEYRQPLQELFRSEVVYSQGKNEIQLLLAPGWAKGGPPRAGVAAEYGVTDSWQVGISAEGPMFRSFRSESSEGEGALGIGIKRAFRNVRPGIHLAAGVEGVIEEGPGSAYRPYVVAARDILNRRGQVFLAGSATVFRELGATSRSESGWGAGAFLPVGDVMLTHEWTWADPSWRLIPGRGEVYSTTGVVWRTRGEPGWEIGVGTSVGVSGPAHRLAIIVKLSREWQGPRRLQ
jgi:hypothetical protein